MATLRPRLIGALLAALAAACADMSGPVSTDDPGAPIPLRVMTFNIEWGGTHVSFPNVVDAIRRADADIVGIQEAEGNLERLAAELDWYYDRRSYVISRFPVVDPPGADGNYVYVEVTPGRVVAVANVHLPSDPYGPYAVLDGAEPAAVLALEQATRMPSLRKTLDALETLGSRDLPVFVTGDFNSPAHTDWTSAVAEVRSSVRYPLDWPVSRAMEKAGFVDSYRELKPDPVADAGFTWWAARPPIPHCVLTDDEPRDRIDFIWYSGPATVHRSFIVGEPGAAGVTLGIAPWPSDHRAVASEFNTVPAAVPDLVTTDRRVYQQGQPIDIVYFLSHDLSADIRFAGAGNAPVTAAQLAVSGKGRYRIAADAARPARYALDATLSDGRKLPPREFWVLAHDAAPTIVVRGDGFDKGEPIDVCWQNGPGHRNDYLAIYPDGESPSEAGDPVWIYLDARPEGCIRLDTASAGRHWPLASGNHVAWVIEDDGYEPLARSAAFTVR